MIEGRERRGRGLLLWHISSGLAGVEIEAFSVSAVPSMAVLVRLLGVRGVVYALRARRTDGDRSE